jgi:hypothetical protein
MPENLPLFYDNIYKALNVLVSICGGSKDVAGKLWPTKKDAEKWLSDCLNPDRQAKLDPEEFMALLRMARERNFHGVMEFVATESGYARPAPTEPEDETNELRREVRDLLQAANQRLERIERAEQRPRVKAVG